jgi:hypothetical protein
MPALRAGRRLAREGIFASFVAGLKKKKIHESLYSQYNLSQQIKPGTSYYTFRLHEILKWHTKPI